MSLFGSIGIGPVRVGASTRGGGGGFWQLIGLLLIVGLIVKFWLVILICAAVALGVWGLVKAIQRSEDTAAEKARTEATIIERANEQHTAMMDGDDRAGTYGEYPPADL